MDPTAQLAQYARGIEFADLPSEVITTAKLCVLDTVGVALGSSGRQWSSAAADVAATGAGPCVVWGTTAKVSEAHAALANGTSSHGMEMDDRSPKAQVHPGCSAIPAAVAILEANQGSGTELLASVVAGYEVGLRVGYSMKFLKEQGFHSSGHKGVWPGVGAAIRASRLPSDAAGHALGLAGSMACGLNQFSQDPHGTMVKRLHGGLAALHGVLAAQLAAAGMSGPRAILEGRYGYCNVFTPPGTEPDIEQLTAGLGYEYRIMERELKPYAAWGGSHNAIDAVRQIMDAKPIDPQRITAVHIAGSNRLIKTHEMQRPESIMAAQYSLPFLTAIAINRGARAFMNPNSLWDNSILGDDDIVRLSTQTSLSVDPRLEELSLAKNHYGGARVELVLDDGSRRSDEVTDSWGTVKNPMSPDDIVEKFRRVASITTGPDRVAAIEEAVMNLENIADVRDFTRLLGESG